MGTLSKTPIACSNDQSIGGPYAWLAGQAPHTMLQQVSAIDGASECPAMGIPGQQAIYGLQSLFDFSDLPSDADGVPITVTFSVTKKATNSLLADIAARLVVGGVTQSADQSQAGQWPTAMTTVQYVFSGLSAADLRPAGFGFSLAAKNTGAAGPEKPKSVPYVDAISAEASW